MEGVCDIRYDKNTIFIIMGKFHDFGKIQFRLSQPKLYPLGTF